MLPEGVDPHAFKDWMAPKPDGGEYNAQDVMNMFSKLGDLPPAKQKAGAAPSPWSPAEACSLARDQVHGECH